MCRVERNEAFSGTITFHEFDQAHVLVLVIGVLNPLISWIVEVRGGTSIGVRFQNLHNGQSVILFSQPDALP